MKNISSQYSTYSENAGSFALNASGFVLKCLGRTLFLWYILFKVIPNLKVKMSRKHKKLRKIKKSRKIKMSRNHTKVKKV